MNGPVLSLRNVSKKFKRLTALRGISIDVSPSEITGIIGPDGAGKSTLLKICSGILSYDGSVLYRGMEVKRKADAVKAQLSFMPQGIGQNLYMNLTVEENIDFFASLKGVSRDARHARKERLLIATGLEPFRRRYAGELSGGMKQKLGICCSLISMPDLLILDEPSTGIDPLSRRQLWDILNEALEDGTTIMLGTSYMDEAERCHNINLLDEGRVRFSGHPERLIAEREGLEAAFSEMLLKEKGLQPMDIPFKREEMAGGEGSIEIKGVYKYFDSFEALRDVSLSIRQGEVFGLLGPNGAGKTTLIKCMTGLLVPDKGEITISGMRGGDKRLRQRIGYMSQIFSLYGDLTVRENIDLYGTLYGIKGETLRQRREWIIEISGLAGYEDVIIKRLPTGMKQRLALGCATLNLPSILFLDEPTSGVDPLARRQFWQFIRGLSERLGITVVVTTHNLVEADYCDRVAIMNEGMVIAVDSTEALRGQFTEASGDVYELYPVGAFDREIFSGHDVEITPFGRRYHLWGRGIDEGSLKGILLSKNVRYRYLKRIRPPMEDVFIYFLRRGA
jgi:ABC-type multidrug transport system ATPase subunit